MCAVFFIIFLYLFYTALPTPLVLSVFINKKKRNRENEIKKSLILKYSNFHTFTLWINTNQYQISIFFMTVLWINVTSEAVKSRGRKMCVYVSGVIKIHVLLRWRYWMSLNPWVNWVENWVVLLIDSILYFIQSMSMLTWQTTKQNIT